MCLDMEADVLPAYTLWMRPSQQCRTFVSPPARLARSTTRTGLFALRRSSPLDSRAADDRNSRRRAGRRWTTRYASIRVGNKQPHNHVPALSCMRQPKRIANRAAVSFMSGSERHRPYRRATRDFVTSMAAHGAADAGCGGRIRRQTRSALWQLASAHRDSSTPASSLFQLRYRAARAGIKFRRRSREEYARALPTRALLTTLNAIARAVDAPQAAKYSGVGDHPREPRKNDGERSRTSLGCVTIYQTR